MASLFGSQVQESGNELHGCSKAQACLKKILHIISTVPPCQVPNSLPRDDERGFGIDLNLRLGSLGTFLESEKSTKNSFVGKEKENETETDSSFGVEVNRDGEYTETIAEKTTPEASSDITDLHKVEMQDVKGVGSGDGNENGGNTGAAPSMKKRRRDNDSLALLIQAAETISDLGSPSQDQKVAQSEEITSGSKKKSWADKCEIRDFEDISPVVRSRRGRSQVLPFRYRDSILEPLRRPQRSAVDSKGKRTSK